MVEKSTSFMILPVSARTFLDAGASEILPM